MGLSQHANEPSPAVLHRRGHHHPHPDQTTAALAEATEHSKRGWGVFWLDQRQCAVCSLIIIIIISHVLEV